MSFSLFSRLSAPLELSDLDDDDATEELAHAIINPQQQSEAASTMARMPMHVANPLHDPGPARKWASAGRAALRGRSGEWGDATNHLSMGLIRAMLLHASADAQVDETRLEGLTRAVVQMLQDRDALAAFVRYCAACEAGPSASPHCWRERTALMMVLSVAADCSMALRFLSSCVDPLLDHLRAHEAPDPLALLGPMAEMLDNMLLVMGALPPLQCFVFQAAYEATQRSRGALTLCFFLRFVLPYLSHPSHAGVPRAAIVCATRMLSHIAGSQRDNSDWPAPVGAFCDAWRARMTAGDFFAAIVHRPLESLAVLPRGNVRGMRTALLKYVRLNLARLHDPDADMEALQDALAEDLLTRE